MIALIEILLTFVGVMLVLALAAQSLQEMIKIVFAIKGHTRLKALRGLIVEASVANGQAENVGQQIYESVTKRLAALGQDGVRPGKLRLDRLGPAELQELITSSPIADSDALNKLECEGAKKCLDSIAEQCKKWFALAMAPVAERYKRRMRGYALFSAAVVVLAVNANAIKIFQQARNDREFRGTILSAVAVLDSLDRVAREMIAASRPPTESQAPAVLDLAANTAVWRADTAGPAAENLGQATDTATGGPGPVAAAQVDSIAAVRDTIQTMALRLATAEEGFLVGIWEPPEPRKPEWWVGILISTLLVSLGAPFWHDVLGSLFGLKNRINAQAGKAEVEKIRAERNAT